MSRDILEGTLKQLRDALRQRREVLTDKDLGAVDINLDRLPSLLRARCGCTGEQAEKERRNCGRKSAGTIVDAREMSAAGTVKKGITGSKGAESSSCIVMPKGRSHPT